MFVSGFQLAEVMCFTLAGAYFCKLSPEEVPKMQPDASAAR